LHLNTVDNGMAFLVPTSFAPTGNSFYGRMWAWVDAFPTRPDYAHFTMVEASGTGNSTLVRALGGQYIPGKANGTPLWGTSSDGGPTGDWTNWQETTPTAGGRWTCLEWQMRSADNSVNVWIDGVAKPELSVSTKNHGGNNVDFIFPNFNKIRLGWQLYQGGATPGQFNIWLDDIALTTNRVGCGTGTNPIPTTGIQWRGVSLAGAEFAPEQVPGTYDTHYVYPSAASVSYFKGKGMDTVRLPFLWERLQPALNQSFDATELSRLTSFVQQVTATGVNVVLDPHNYARYRGNLIGSSQVPNAAFADFWSRLATLFKDNNKVIFGLMNEPHDMPTEQWLAGANAGLAAIRATGAGNVVTVPGNAWTGAHSWQENWYGTANGTVMKGIVDPGRNMVFEVHQYLDGDSSGNADTCVSNTIGSERLRDFTTWLRSNGYRALLGELGGAANSTCNQAVANMLDHVRANADVWAGWTWWAAGPWWANYMYSIEPSGTTDKPQMSVLQPYLSR
jgi:aryl-phospho-beta-D-glucosidase BglC (GH1 family)